MNDINDKKPVKSSTVQSVVVASQLLELLAESGRPQRVTDIAALLGMTKARVSRHLSTLSDLGLVARMPDKSGYRLGPALFRLSNAALDQYEITNIAYRYMVMLRNQIKESLLLAIPAAGDALDELRCLACAALRARWPGCGHPVGMPADSKRRTKSKKLARAARGTLSGMNIR